MEDLAAISTTLRDPRSAPEPPVSWQTIGEQRDFYDERDCLGPSNSLANERLKNRTERDIVIFSYSLDPNYLRRASGNPAERNGPSSRPFDADHDIFFPVSKDDLIESRQFAQIINPTEEPLPIQSRLGIM